MTSRSIEVIEICRFCAQTSCKASLLNLAEDNDQLKKCLVMLEFLNIIHYVDLSAENNLPKTICDVCYISLTEAYVFANKVLQSQKNFRYLEVEVKREVDGNVVEVFELPEIDIKEIPQVVIEDVKELSKTLDEKFKIKEQRECTAASKNETCSERDIEPPCAGRFYAGVSVFNKMTPRFYQNKSYKSDESISENDSDYVEFKYAGISTFNDSDKAWAFYNWRCKHCSLRFDSLALLRTHSTATHDTCFAYTCDDCNTNSQKFDEFIEHIRAHRDNLRFFCKYCDHYNETIEECIQHEKNHNEFFKACVSCGELFDSAVTLAQHQKKVVARNISDNVDKTENSDDSLSSVSFDETHPEGSSIPPPEHQIDSWKDYPWICLSCRTAFPSLEQWRTHCKMKHNKCATYKCFDCKNYRCRKLRHLLGHIRQHRPNLTLQCHFCCEVKKDNIDLRKHIAGHLQNYLWCDYCGERFTEQEGLAAHLNKYKVKKPVRKVLLTVEDLTCNVCRKICRNKNALTAHLMIHGDQKYACEICGKTFKCKTNLSAHLLCHNKQYVCDLCNKGFPTRRTIMDHLDIHYGTQKFACEDCGRKFKNGYRLRQHKLVHTTVSPFVCEICNKAFRRELYLKKHYFQHTGEKPYLCKYCQKAFTNSANRHKHMKRIHKYKETNRVTIHPA